jgi:citrate lyase subunit gamma (acyl carrier protein)
MEFTDKAVKCGTDKKGDLLVTLELTGKERNIEIHSKVEKKFGEAIRADVTEILDQYKIAGANVLVNDLGALGFAVRARVETAVKRALAREVK